MWAHGLHQVRESGEVHPEQATKGALPIQSTHRVPRLALHLRATFVSAELTEEQKAKKQKLIKQIEEELDL